MQPWLVALVLTLFCIKICLGAGFDDWKKPAGGVQELNEDGKPFVRLTSSKPGQVIRVATTRPVTPEDQAIEVTFRARWKGIKPGKRPWSDGRMIIHPVVMPEGKRVKFLPTQPSFRGDSDGWQAQSSKFKVPKGVNTLELIISLEGSTAGQLDVADVEVKRIDPATTPDVPQTSMASPVVPKPTTLPSELHVEGNKIKNARGEEVWLQGLALPSLEWTIDGENTIQAIEVAIEDWNANCIRLPMHEDKWFGKHKDQTDGGAGYRQLIDSAINATTARGAYFVLDLHRFRAPSDAHVEFWKDFAEKYKNHPGVIFELFNEAHDVTWEVWRNGGPVTDKKLNDKVVYENKEALTRFTSPGHQKMIDVIRATGAKNIIIAGGLDWSYDLSGILKGYALDDKGGNGLVYSSHVYPWKRDWQKKFLDVAEKYPLFIGECGGEEQPMPFLPPSAHEDPYTWSPDMIGIIQKHKLHWTGWSFHPRATPRVIQDFYYTPTPFWGDHVKRALAGEQFPVKKLR
jgi:endoglucanase